MKEIEMNSKQIERIDEVENACFEFCKLLTEKDDLEWNISFIGEIADVATDILVRHGLRVHYPAIVEDGETHEERIIEYVTAEPQAKH